ncbi:Flp family type IVb pilin [Novosphingobium aerophilum]|uniref:Flp family type IVb pilin n=1 Tax=Novosphingobium TaxID=165696 RepID=UPI0006C8604C|nr:MULTISPECIES: pilus assembly protein [unclassified Novosphingobium]KPH65891.1 pilus assembly protein [Novosphingobium sp. ST904]MPS70157.1 Flp family type IVb pilin [Novosphingobium sp.]TCM35244.1 pilus assembly protein Flp/PilA [Novosphingobium sp. ST904]WRT94867.1 Flp family type IVb pilin [Novosphingobium sp. RL4]
MKTIRKLFARLIADERGLTAVEYAVLGAIVVGAISSIGTAFGSGLTGAFQTMIDNFS